MVTYPNAMVASFDLFLDQNGQKTGKKLLLQQYHFNSEESKCSFSLYKYVQHSVCSYLYYNLPKDALQPLCLSWTAFFSWTF